MLPYLDDLRFADRFLADRATVSRRPDVGLRPRVRRFFSVCLVLRRDSFLLRRPLRSFPVVGVTGDVGVLAGEALPPPTPSTAPRASLPSVRGVAGGMGLNVAPSSDVMVGKASGEDGDATRDPVPPPPLVGLVPVDALASSESLASSSSSSDGIACSSAVVWSGSSNT